MSARRHELRDAMPGLVALGLTSAAIAQRLGCTPRTVGVVRAELGLSPVRQLPKPKVPPKPKGRPPGYVVAGQRTKKNARERFKAQRLVCACTCGFRTGEMRAPEAVAELRVHVCTGT